MGAEATSEEEPNMDPAEIFRTGRDQRCLRGESDDGERDDQSRGAVQGRTGSDSATHQGATERQSIRSGIQNLFQATQSLEIGDGAGSAGSLSFASGLSLWWSGWVSLNRRCLS